MQTNRLKFQNIDQSNTVGTATAITGACVIKASKGLNYPQLVQKGDTQTFLNLFGAPSSTYPGVQEAIEFLNNYSLWVSAPGGQVSAINEYSYYGGVYLTTLASIESFYQVTENSMGQPEVNYLTLVESGDGSPLSGNSITAYNNTTYVLSVSNIPSAFFQSALIDGAILTYTRMDGTTAVVNFTVSGSNLQVMISGTATTVGSITSTGLSINSNTSYLNGSYADLNFQAMNTTFPNSGFMVQWIYNIQSYVIMALYQNSPRTTNGIMSLISAYSVDTRSTIYPSYSSNFTVTGTGSISASTQYSFTICGVTVSATTASAISTTSGLVSAIQAAMVGVVLPPGYTVSYNSNTITVQSTNSVAAPSITFGTNIPSTFLIGYEAIYTLSGSGTLSNATVTLGGFTMTTISGASASAIATAIVSAYPTGYPSSVSAYTVTANGSTLVINYPPNLPLPTLLLGTGTTGYSSVLTTNPITGTGTSLTNSNYNTVTFTYSELAYTGYNYTNTYTLSPDSTKVDSQGNSLYANTVLQGDNFLGAVCYQQFYNTASGYNWSSSVNTISGSRAVNSSSFTPTYLPTVLSSGWSQMTVPALQNVNIFFDPECDPATASTMATLRTSTYPFSTFITGIKVSNGVSVSTSDITSVVNNLVSARSEYPNLTGLAYYCNEFYMSETYNSTSYWNIPIGSVASMLAMIMDYRMGGVAPLFTNEGSPGLGGQINRTVQHQKYIFNADSLDTLDAVGVNPIILDDYYGLMITSQKTAQSALSLTDWSYLGHQMSFDLFEAIIRQNVMLPQIGKLIDAYHMKLRRETAGIYLSQRISGANAIWSDGKVFVESENTPATMAQNNFMIKIRVKVTPFSEWVTLIFNNVGQNSSVSAQ